MSSTRQLNAASLRKQACQLRNKLNHEAATIYYDKAIILGDTLAMVERAYMHQIGQGGSVDYAKAIELYERVINLLQTNCPQDERNAYAWSLNNRAVMHSQGQGGPVDYAKAIELYEKSITFDSNSNATATAIYNRANMHEMGHGGPVDFIAANRLYLLADKQVHNTDDSAMLKVIQVIHTSASTVNIIGTSSEIRNQLIHKHDRLLNYGFHHHAIPNIIIECEKLKDALMMINSNLLDLLRDYDVATEKSLPETKKLQLINNKLRHHPQPSDIHSDLETVTAVLSSGALPQALQCIAKHLQSILSYEASKLNYIQTIKQTLDALKSYLDTTKDTWQIKWLGKWKNGIPKHIKKMQNALATYDSSNDIVSLLKTYNIILNIVDSITANENRHTDVREFYHHLKETLANVSYATPAPCMSLDKLAAPIPPATYGTLVQTVTACTTETIRQVTPPPSYAETMQPLQDQPAAITVEYPASAHLYPRLNDIGPLQRDNQFIKQTTNLVLTAPAQSTAAAAAAVIEQPAATSISKQFSTQTFSAFFPPVPQHPLPAINNGENLNREKLRCSH